MGVSKGVCVGLGILVLVIGVVLGFLAGYFTHSRKHDSGKDHGSKHSADVFNHAPGPCKLVGGVETGSEDMVVLPSGLVIMTAGMKYLLPRDRPDLLNRTGSLKLFDFNDVNRGVSIIPVINEDNFDYVHFNPHGLNAWTDDATGRVVVFVVNHNYFPDQIETIEKFEFSESNRELTHVETIAHENMIVVNNLIATSPDTFYYTNFLSTTDPEEGRREMSEQIPSGSIGYYDGTQARILQRGYKSPNGINISPDGRFLYVAEFATGEFHTFKVADDHSISPFKQHSLNTGIDNLDIVGEYVWIGCHPNLDLLFEYSHEPNGVATPSQVLRLKMEEGAVKEVTEVYMDDGNKFSGITVAVTYGNKMLMGSVFTKAMYCDLHYVG